MEVRAIQVGIASYQDVLLTAAASLDTRFDATVGCVRSWDWGSWSFPVIIDNMMNLELLLWAAQHGGPASLRMSACAALLSSPSTLTIRKSDQYASDRERGLVEMGRELGGMTMAMPKGPIVGRVCCFAAVLFLFVAASCDSDSGDGDNDGDGGSNVGPNWFTDDCATLGGTLSPGGACYIPCTDPSQCPAGTVGCDGTGSPLHRYCAMEDCDTDADCGPAGWACSWSSCVMPCTSSTGESEQSPECPFGMACRPTYGGDVDYYCAQFDQSSSCGVACPEGCCSPSGLSCCEPPFCSGDCLGSPCC